MDSKKADLDRVDRALLRALSVNARASGAALAAEIGVAESTVSLRLRRLQQLGHIRGYRAIIDLAALGASLQALISVRLAKHARGQIDEFRDEAPHWPGVIGMFHTAGADDYLLTWPPPMRLICVTSSWSIWPSIRPSLTRKPT